MSDSKDHKPGIDNGGPFFAMNPFSSRCCQHNHARLAFTILKIWFMQPITGLPPLFTVRVVQAKVGVNGTEVILREETKSIRLKK